MNLAHRMRLILAIVVLAGLGAGSLHAADAASNNKGKIEGTKWTSQAATIKGNKFPAGALKLEFGKDGSLVYTAGPGVFKGTYTLGAGNKVTFKLDLSKENKGTKTEQETIVIKGNKLTMTDATGITLTFDKTK